jgi:hypothetical protein
MARCLTCFVETAIYFHTLRGHFCSMGCAERSTGVMTMDLGRLLSGQGPEQEEPLFPTKECSEPDTLEDFEDLEDDLLEDEEFEE